MLRHANDILGQILFVVFFILMGGVPLGILILGILNLVRSVTRQGTVVLQALASLLIWAFLSYVLIMIFIMVVFSLPYPLSPVDEWKSPAVFAVGCLVYAAAGAVLIYWTKRQAKLSRTAPGDTGAVESSSFSLCLAKEQPEG